MKLSRKNLKKGFTLVEVIIALTITGLLVVAAMSLFRPVRALTNTIEENVHDTEISDSVLRYVFTKVSKSVTYDIALFSEANFYQSLTTEADSTVYKASTMLGKIKNPDVEKLYCLVLKCDGDSDAGDAADTEDGCYYVYDLGQIKNTNDFITRRTALDKYRVFNEEFYSGGSFKFTFEATLSGGNDWCTMGISAYDDDGMLQVEERHNMFRLLNVGNASDALPPPRCDENLKSVENYEDNEIIVIFYIIKDFSIVTPTSP